MEGDCLSSAMLTLMPVYIPVPSQYMAPYQPFPPGPESQAPESVPESAPERGSSHESAPSLPDKEAAARANLEKVYEHANTWYPYAQDLWLRASVLKLLNDSRRRV